MANEKIIWKGGSGREYTFYIRRIKEQLYPEDGNYIFARKEGSEWKAIYIGEGNIRKRTQAHLRENCVTKKRATHIHVHTNLDPETRKAEESDLLEGNPEAYAPTGCNKKKGG